MALRLQYNLPKNKQGDYWRILSIANNFEDNEVVMYVGLWTNEQSALAKDEPIYVETVTQFQGEDNPFSIKELSKARTNPKSIGYNALKTLSFPINFTLADDC